MNMKLLVIPALAAVSLSSCYTTHIALGKERSGKVESATWPQGLFDTSPVDMSKHCNGGNIAEVTLERSFFGDSVKFNCAKGAGHTSEDAESNSKVAVD